MELLNDALEHMSWDTLCTLQFQILDISKLLQNKLAVYTRLRPDIYSTYTITASGDYIISAKKHVITGAKVVRRTLNRPPVSINYNKTLFYYKKPVEHDTDIVQCPQCGHQDLAILFSAWHFCSSTS